MEAKVRDIFSRTLSSHPDVDLSELKLFEASMLEHVQAMVSVNNLRIRMSKEPSNLELSQNYFDMVQMTRNSWVDLMADLNYEGRQTLYFNSDDFFKLRACM